MKVRKRRTDLERHLQRYCQRRRATTRLRKRIAANAVLDRSEVARSAVSLADEIMQTMKVKCGWPNPKCDNEATQHVIYGERSEELPSDDERGVLGKIGLRRHQADLCDKHVDELKKSYTDVAATPLN